MTLDPYCLLGFFMVLIKMKYDIHFVITLEKGKYIQYEYGYPIAITIKN